MSRGHWWWVAACVAYVAAAAYLVFAEPTIPQAGIEWLTRGFAFGGVHISDDRSGFLLNIALFVPAGALGIRLFPRSSPVHWTTAGFVLSFAIEVVQHYLLPARTGQSQDVVANTLGALVGSTAMYAARLVSQRSASEN